MKNIILCADDFGLNSAVSEGIIELLSNHRLSAVSCMTTSKAWLVHARKLVPFRGMIDIGWHIDLTECVPLTSLPSASQQGRFLSLGLLAAKSQLRLLKKEAIERELDRQLDRFIEGMGCLPDFIDGHQHVHQFPIIRNALLAVYQARLSSHRAYLRIPTNGLLASLSDPKRLMITLMGALSLRASLKRLGIPFNPSFSGSYRFAHAAQYDARFPTFLDEVKNGGLVMCHPGYASGDTTDAIHATREYEFRYLISQQFIEDCRIKKVSLIRGRSITTVDD